LVAHQDQVALIPELAHSDLNSFVYKAYPTNAAGDALELHGPLFATKSCPAASKGYPLKFKRKAAWVAVHPLASVWPPNTVGEADNILPILSNTFNY
jgi:hypothetical protein